MESRLFRFQKKSEGNGGGVVMKDPCKKCKDVHEACKIDCFAHHVHQEIKKRKMKPGIEEKNSKREYESFISDVWSRKGYRPQY